MIFSNWKSSVDNWNQTIMDTDDINKDRLHDKLYVDYTNKIHEQTDVQIPDQEKSQYSDAITNDMMGHIISNNAFNTISDLENLSNIIKVLNWTINNCTFTSDNLEQYNTFAKAIDWACELLHYFIKELHVPETPNRIYTGLTRSSYKLCPQKSNCSFQYPDDENAHSYCKNQHYPYANLYIDALSIKQYVGNKISSLTNESKGSKLISATSDFNTNELKRCLSTINYVIMIMYRELETIIKYRANEANFNVRKYHKYHCNVRYNKNDRKAKTDVPFSEREPARPKTTETHTVVYATPKLVNDGQTASKFALLQEAQRIQQQQYTTQRSKKL
jgi:hypothetical protein